MRVGIVGGGFCGITLARRLLDAGVDVLVFDPAGLGRCVPYNPPRVEHLLNVPAENMSWDPEDPGHFQRWLQERGRSAEGFLPRTLYGEYLRDLAQGIPHEPRWVTDFETLSREFDALVIATGMPVGGRLEGSFPPYDESDWPKTADTVVIAGSGLTAADAAISARERYPAASILAVSPFAQWPRIHRDVPKATIDLHPLPATLREAVRRVRGQAKAAEDWRSVMDAYRHHWNDIWQALPQDERDRYIRKLRLRHLFNIHRHRIPEAAMARVDADLISGRVHRFQNSSSPGGRGSGTVRLTDGTEIPADLLIDATGAQFMPPSIPVGSNIHPLGYLRRGEHFETTAVPDLRIQVRDLATRLIST